MGVKGFGSFVKYSMFLFNAVILVAGCGLVGFGIYTRTNSSGITKFSSILGSNLLPTVSLILIVTGSIIILLSFLGCCGAIKEVKCMLVTFFLLLLLIFLAFLVGGILMYAFRERIEDITLDQLKLQLSHSYGEKGEESVTEGWDYMQKLVYQGNPSKFVFFRKISRIKPSGSLKVYFSDKNNNTKTIINNNKSPFFRNALFKCCGVIGGVNSTQSWAFYKLYSNWYHATSNMGIIEYVPVSCCKDSLNTPNITKCQGIGRLYANKMPAIGPPVPERSMNDQIYTQGCYTAFNNMIKENTNIFIFVGIGITVTMILGMVFSLCLCRRIKDEDYYDDCD